MLTLKTDRQVVLIVNSFRRVFKTGDINQLTKQAYHFISLASGFIAHYNLYGFREHYKNVWDIEHDMMMNFPANQWFNFRPGEKDYDYMMQKKKIYNRIYETALDYIPYER